MGAAAMLPLAKTSLNRVSVKEVEHYPDGSNAVTVLIEHGHPVPPTDQWWTEHPSAEEVIDALVPPARQTKGICVQRLWLPRDTQGWKAVDSTLLEAIEKKPWGAHQLAMCAHYRTSLRQAGQAAQLMERARTWFWDPKKETRVYCPYRTRNMLSRLLCLDWIEWEDVSEFERAFELVRADVQSHIDAMKAANHALNKDGYWNATHTIESPFYIEELLALCVCNVNPQGASTLWARDRLKHLGARPAEDPDLLYSSFEFGNVLSLLSRRGGGREYGQQERKLGLGGYEALFASGGMIQLEAVDTATNRKWKLRNRNLYLRTRQLGLITEIDRTVAKTSNGSSGNAVISILARFYRDEPEFGGLYQWCLEGEAPSFDFREFQALAGRAPRPVPPKKTPLAERVGSRWHYRKNPSQPDSTLRLWITNRDLECFRIAPDERCMSLAVGSVGLVDGQANRCYPIGLLANGVAFTTLTSKGEPYVATADFWPIRANHHPYWSPDRPLDAQQVLEDPRYLVGTDGPTLVEGKWRWTRDYSDTMTQVLKSPIIGKVKRAKMEFEFDPERQRVEITDTIQADDDIYVGWHFSPSHEVKLLDLGFRFGDGKDEIRVSIQGLNGTELEVKRRKEWVHDGYTLRMDWHERPGDPKRIAENIGYSPSAHRSEYRVQVVIEANPRQGS